jgi:23S rRNA (cytidine1920-2'-O)/16S rRNA (cytidine1409-2'-O)-methyltransferase
VARKAKARLRPLATELARVRPDINDPAKLIAAGAVLVDGRPQTNPRSLVRPGSSIVVRTPRQLRGEAKLAAALGGFGIDVRGTALDLGAAAGGFTRALLAAGAARVVAVDVGHGQLLGSLRLDPRVVNLEGTNLGELAIDETIDIAVADLSYVSLAAAVPQLERVPFTRDAQLVALVKPMFELALDQAPREDELLSGALDAARHGVEHAGWRLLGDMTSPVRGARGAVEFFVHARR